MTDNTQPEALRTIKRFYRGTDCMAENQAGDWVRYEDHVAAATELRSQHARIAELEAELEAVGAGGVQALSAAPEAIAKLRHLYQNMVNGAVRDTASAKRIAEGLLAPAIEALERATPPAEQQAAPKAAPGESASSLAVPDGCPHILWFDDQDLKPVVFAGNGAKRAALEAYRQASMQWNAHLFVRIAVNSRDCQYPCAAPQQEAQEPSRDAKTWCSYVAGMIGCYLKKPDESAEVRAIAGIIERRLWALPAPQPAPAPLSDDAKDAARYRWLRATTNYVTSKGERIDVRNHPDLWDAVIDAAIAAQGGK